jgi:hypothetical protein
VINQMSSSFKKFLIKNLFVSILLVVIGWVLFSTFLSDYYQNIFGLLVVFAMFINLSVFYIVTKKSYTASKTPQIIIISFAIKFFTYLGISLFFFMVDTNLKHRLAFILVLFCVYLIYTFLEITSLTRYFKA